MKIIRLYIYIIIISVAPGYGQSLAPQVINAAGNSSQNKGYSIEWSIGELALVNEMDAMDNSYIFTNGFIQPTGALTPPPPLQNSLSSNKIEFNSANIRIFPNPTQDIVEINFQNISGKVSVQLYNELGHIIYTHESSTYGSGLIEKINMKNFTNGIYILYIKRLNPVSGRYDLETGSYKIIKL